MLHREQQHAKKGSDDEHAALQPHLSAVQGGRSPAVDGRALCNALEAEMFDEVVAVENQPLLFARLLVLEQRGGDRGLAERVLLELRDAAGHGLVRAVRHAHETVMQQA